MNDAPVILLDVDGVLNVSPKAPKDSWDDFQKALCAGFSINYSAEMGRRLKALNTEIVWLTTWERDDLANKWIAPLFGWDDLPILHAGEEWFRPGWWKSTVLQKFIMENPRPFVWIDDDLYGESLGGSTEWVRHCGVPYILISPDGKNGLEARHFDIIEAFLGDPTSTVPDTEKLT